MTTIDDILALAAQAAPTEQSAADLVAFTKAVTLGVHTDVVRALRALRPGSLPDSPAWRAWLSATAAIAGARAGGAARPTPDLTVRFVVCAAATATDGASGADCFAAIAAGNAAAGLVESGLADAGGWYVPAIAAVIGGGIAAGMMLRLPETSLRHALGICATQAAALRAATGTAAGPLQAGKAAFNAVEAAHLARLGFTSSREPLDGRRGLFALFNP